MPHPGVAHCLEPTWPREVYRACLDVIPHKSFTFAKIWLLLAKFEVRHKDLTAARKVLGQVSEVVLLGRGGAPTPYLLQSLSLGVYVTIIWRRDFPTAMHRRLPDRGPTQPANRLLIKISSVS